MSPPRQAREFLLTGVTGFLGKVVLSELLRRREELDLETVHVLIRPGHGTSAEQRFQRRVLSSACFSELPVGWQDHVRPVSGDLSLDSCGLQDEQRADLLHHVTHVIHCAASIDFDLPLAEAAGANITSSLNVLRLARTCERLESMLAVSTAYVTPSTRGVGTVHERLAQLPRPAASIYEDILNDKISQEDLLDETDQPNCYTLTKCLAEHLLWEQHGDVRLTIVRPSIISACWRHPFAGWIDSHAAFAGFVTMVGAGQLRAIVAEPAARMDIVPCDEVATRIIDGSVSNGASAEPRIIHATAGIENCSRVDTCSDVITEFFARQWIARRPKVTYLGPQCLQFRLRDWFHHRLRAAMARLWYGLTGQLHLRRRVRSLMERLDYLNRVFPYFTQRTFDFHSSAPLDHASFDATAYLRAVCRGVNHHLLRRDESETSFAGRLHQGVRSDLRWVVTQPRGNWVVRAAAYLVTKALRRCADRFTVDLPAFEAARTAAGDRPLVIIPSHRSYMDFVLCSFLFFSRPDLEIPIPSIAATDDFARIPVLGRLFTKLGAFYLTRGLGAEDTELTRKVRALTSSGETLQFFIEGSRSRSRQFLPPRRGLLRCLQGTGDAHAILPVAFTYDHVPEEAAFVEELEGAPKPKMRLRPLLGWTLRLFGRGIDLGRIHVSCAQPVLIDKTSDVHSVSRRVIAALRSETTTTTHQLRCFLAHNPIEGVDLDWLRNSVLARGSQVLTSDLTNEEQVSPLIERCMRYDWTHVFYPDLVHAFPEHPVVRSHVRRNGPLPKRPGDSQVEPDSRLRHLLLELLEPLCRDYLTVVASLGSPSAMPAVPSAQELVRQSPDSHLPSLEEAFEDLVERQILRRDAAPGEGYVWGSRASDLADYRKACAWPGLSVQAAEGSFARHC